jgi:hypothetical protein
MNMERFKNDTSRISLDLIFVRHINLNFTAPLSNRILDQRLHTHCNNLITTIVCMVTLRCIIESELRPADEKNACQFI